MNTRIRVVLPIVPGAIGIGVSEFVRNEFLLESYWVDQCESLGLVFFPGEPINGAI